jgi:cytochrome c peroxidase
MSNCHVPSLVAGITCAAVPLVLMGVPQRDTTSASTPVPRVAPAPLTDADTLQPAAATPVVESFPFAPLDPANEPVEPLPTDIEELFEDFLEVDYVPERIELGRVLFHDPRLSADDTISCASCHDLRYAGIDRAVTATGIRGQIGPINTPTVFNAALHFMQFWDGRAASLEHQADGPPNASGEMGSSWEEITAKLRRDGRVMELLTAAYPDEDFSAPDATITPHHWTLALADFERTLITGNAPFDRFLQGDTTAVSDRVKEGYQVFKDVGCFECHSGAGLGGKSLQRMGRKRPYFDVSQDGVHLGRFTVTGNDEDRFVFKVPSLRNVALTAPYYHDGSRATLEEAVRTMGAVQLDVDLTQGQVERLVTFLEALTGEYLDMPLGQHQNTTTHPAQPKD